MGLPSLKKLFNLKSGESYESLNRSYEQIRQEFVALSRSHDAVIKENERLRTRLAKVGLKLSALKSIEAAENRKETDIVDQLEDKNVQALAVGIDRVKQLSPDTSTSQYFSGTTAGYFVKFFMKRYGETEQGAQVCKFFESLDENQMNILKTHFAKQYESFQVDCYNTVCVLAALYDDGWNVPVDTPVVNEILKKMGSQTTLANAIMLCLPNHAKFRKGGGKINQVEQLFDYLINNPNTDKTIANLCKSFEVSTTTVSRFVYLTFLMTQKDVWSQEL